MSSRYEELYRSALQGELSRRQVVKRALAMGLAIPSITALLAACGDDDDNAAGVNGDDVSEDEDEDDSEDDESDPTAEPTDEPDDEAETPETPDEDDGTGGQSDDDIRITGPYDGEAQSLNGAGASFPAPLYSLWFNEYQQLTGVQVNYQSIGSGGGISSIQDQTVDFGATDGPMSDEQLDDAAGGHIFHIPAAMGAVVPTYNIPELEAEDPIQFTSETLSGIFLGHITAWNDPALVEDNPQLEEIDQDILVVHRSDGSGTTFIFVDYLSSVSEEWADNVGVGTSVNWPVGIGGNGNEGVAGEVNQNAYSIGYVELIYALQNELGVGLVQNQAGNFVEPSIETVSNAAAGFADEIEPDLRSRIVNAPGDDSYPISGFTWLLAYEEQDDEATAIALTRMLWWGVTDAQELNSELDYAPIPEEINAISKEMIWDIKYQGEPAFPGE